MLSRAFIGVDFVDQNPNSHDRHLGLRFGACFPGKMSGEHERKARYVAAIQRRQVRRQQRYIHQQQKLNDLSLFAGQRRPAQNAAQTTGEDAKAVTVESDDLAGLNTRRSGNFQNARISLILFPS
jgi:hypothetical protein